MNDELMHFTIGSSLFITTYPLVYLYYVYQQLTPEQINACPISFSTMAILFPAASGLLFTVFYRLMNFIPRKHGDTIYTRFYVTGALSMLAISLLLDYGLNIYKNWLPQLDPKAIHLFVFGFYLVVYFIIGGWMRVQIIYGSTYEFQKAVESVSAPRSSSTPPPLPPSSSSHPTGRSSVFDAIKSHNT